MQVSPRAIAAVAEDDAAAAELIKPNPEHSDSDSEEQVDSATNHPFDPMDPFGISLTINYQHSRVPTYPQQPAHHRKKRIYPPIV
mmetsp:Transcript_52500/g.77791  ORF Transcript_52500/g.77791 Transcript_52500/m.77791 type:complete len:85 (-) Transcript_52500:434-688(-)